MPTREVLLFQLVHDGKDDPWLMPMLAGQRLDPAARAEYQAWLRARGDARADVFELHDALCEEPLPPNHAELRARLEAILENVNPMWWWFVRRYYGVRNCGEPKAKAIDRKWRFVYECTKSWDLLEPTATPNVRHCGDCNHAVYFCSSDEEVTQRARQGQCVAVTTQLANALNQKHDSHDYVGHPAPNGLWADAIFDDKPDEP